MGWGIDSLLLEEGILKDVELVKDKGRPDFLKLTREYEGKKEIAVLTSENFDFLAQLDKKLKACIGMAIKDVRDVDISF